MSVVFVAGATGKTAAAVVKGLAQQGVRVKAGVRSPAKAADLLTGVPAGSVDLVPFDYSDRAAATAAMQGADKLFLAVPFQADMEELTEAGIAAAKAAGVRHVVKLSGLGAEYGEQGITLARMHYRTEQSLAASGMGWTNLRPNMFMQNILSNAQAIAAGSFSDSFGVKPISAIDVRDVADAAIAALTKPGHEGRNYALTGAEALDHTAVAALFAERLGHPVTYRPVSQDAVRQMLTSYGLPEIVVTSLIELFTLGEQGYLSLVSDDFVTLTGRPQRRWTDFIADHLALFRTAA